MVGMASQSVSGFTSPVSTTRNDDLRKKIIQDNSLDFSSASQHIEDTPSTVTPGDQTCQKIVSVNQIDIWSTHIGKISNQFIFALLSNRSPNASVLMKQSLQHIGMINQGQRFPNPWFFQKMMQSCICITMTKKHYIGQ